VPSPEDELRCGNTAGCYEYCQARSLVRQTSKALGGGLMPFRLSISGLVALSVLTTIVSFRYIHAASTSAEALRDDSPRSPVLVELFTSEGARVALPPMPS